MKCKVVVFSAKTEVRMQEFIGYVGKIILSILLNIMVMAVTFCSYIICKQVGILILYPVTNACRSITGSQCIAALLSL